ncbi:MAG: hypothetical protein RLY20_1519 [Verrucomicrobiota bacterium]|jgi:hypothetical protein
MNNHIRRRLTALFVVVTTIALNTAHGQGNSHKMRVNDPKRAQELIAEGATVIADYGSFQLLAATDAIAAKVSGDAKVESADQMNVIELNAGHLDTTKAPVKALRKARAAFNGKQLHLVQFAGPVKPEWRAELENRGAQIVSHIPNNTYLIYANHKTLTEIQSWAAKALQVQWEGTFADDYKVHPQAKDKDASGKTRDIGTDNFAIQLVEDDDANADTLAAIARVQLAAPSSDYKLLGYRTIVVQLPASQISRIAAQPDVVSIHPYFKRRKFDERQDQIIAGNLSSGTPTGPGYFAWLASKGFSQAQFDTSGFLVDVTDSGIDNGSTTPGHFALFKQGNPGGGSRVVYNRLEGTANSGSTIAGCDGHGNLNAHIISGYVGGTTTSTHFDSGGYYYGIGVCPFVSVGSSVIFDPNTFTSPSYPNLQSRAYNNGARISANSWGANTAGAYDSDAQSYDALVRDAQPAGSSFTTAGNQQMTIVFAAGNAGSAAQTVGSPGTAKNVIVVGAAENVRAFGGSDGSGISDTAANSANDMATFSSRGPCADGRFKPDLVAPGTHVTGGLPQSGSATTNGTGVKLGCFNGEGVSGGVGGVSNYPSGQLFYTASSGTSHSTPAVAGGCALIRQYFINSSLTPPSPAMTKAVLVNSARYMTGTSANDTLPSQAQGMGMMNLGTAFDGVARVLRDQVSGDKFTATGQSRTYNGIISDSSKPFRVTLAWTDAPGSTSGNAYNNNLDLTVTIGTNTYKGNVFSGASSITGGTADAKNNVESVFLPAGTSGNYSVTVTAANVAADGVPNESPTTDQDFALVVYNASETAVPIINGNGFSVSTETCAPTNGAVDPGETVTLNFVLQNAGSAATTNLMATLLATGGVTSPSDPQVYGALAASGGSDTQSFSFTANGACGSNIVATLSLTDGTTDLGNVSYTIQLGAIGTTLAENFDGVSAPSLPFGWTTSAGGAQSAWVTTTTQSYTSPNAAFCPDPASIGSNALVSVAVNLPSGASQLSFRHRYGLESGFDGGVLEIKIGTGAFTDIVTAGGSFVSGGYNATLSTSYSNPLGGRSAWSGIATNAFTNVVVNLPASAAGQAVQFRWRAGSDSSVASLGWWIDSVAITGRICCGGSVTPTIINHPQSVEVPLGSPTGFSIFAVGTDPLAYQWYFNSNVMAGNTATNLAIASVTATNVGSYFAVVTNIYGATTSSVANLTLATAPVITTNPANLSVVAGGSANFSAAASGTAPLAYQWQFDSTNIPGANANSLTISGVTANNAGDYLVIVTNVSGSATSSPATLTVLALPPTTNDVLVGWDVSGQSGFGTSPLAPTTNAGNLTITGFTRASGVWTAGTAASRAWGGNGFDSPSASSALTSNDFITFSVMANAGYQVSFSAVTRFDYRRSPSGPANGVLQFQLDSGAFTDVTPLSYSSSSSSGASLNAIDLSSFTSLQNIGAGTNVTFRILNYSATTTNGTWYIYDNANSTALDFAVQGSVTPATPPAPPASAPMLTNALLSGAQFQFQILGTTGSNYIVQVSTNLADTNWISILTNPAPFTFGETNNLDSPQRFFRARVQP